MTRNEGTWTYRKDGVELSSPSLDRLITALSELGIKPRAEREVKKWESEMEKVVGGSDEWIAAKIRRDIWMEVAYA